MEKAKAAVSEFMHKSGKHDTTVEERAAAPVTQQEVKPHRHEEATTAIDREIHQDHYHTTIQPVHNREVLPEKHHHNVIPVEHKEFSHGNQDETQRKLHETASQFKDTSITHDTTHSTSAAPTVEGERVHHHIHETVQPVIKKETITPEVVHTTVPIHETHHAGAQHHGTSVLPVKEMKDLHSSGGILADGKTRTDYYEGCPKPYNDKMKIEHTDADRDPHIHGIGKSAVSAGTTTSSTNAGPHSSNLANKVDPRVDSDRDGHSHAATAASRAVPGHNHSTNAGTHGGTGLSGAGSAGLGHGGSDTMGSTADTNGTSQKKPSLLDRLNPKKDTDRDGKSGIMD